MFYNNIKFYYLIFLTGHPNNKILKVKPKKKKLHSVTKVFFIAVFI